MDVCMYLVVVGDGHLRGAFALLATLLATTTLCKIETSKQLELNTDAVRNGGSLFKITTNFTAVMIMIMKKMFHSILMFNAIEMVNTLRQEQGFWEDIGMYSQKGSKDENVRYTTEYLEMSSEVYQSRNLYKSYLKFLGGI